MKRCIDCKEEKELSEFNRHREGYQSRCRLCDNASNRAWYQKNKARTLERVKRNNARYVKATQDWVCEYLSNHPCVDCGCDDIVVLQFDHIGTDKTANVGDLISVHRVGRETLEAEIQKCEVVCANCHIRRTASRGNTYRFRFASVA